MISLSGSDLCNSKSSENIYLKSASAHFTQYFRKLARKAKSKACVLDELLISCKMRNRNIFCPTTKNSNLELRLNIKSMDLIHS